MDLPNAGVTRVLLKGTQGEAADLGGVPPKKTNPVGCLVAATTPLQYVLNRLWVPFGKALISTKELSKDPLPQSKQAYRCQIKRESPYLAGAQ